MNENEKALEAINNRFERMEGLSKQQWEALQVQNGFNEAKMEALEHWIKKLEERIESMESLSKLQWEALQAQNAFNEAKMDALEERIEKLGG